MPQLYITKKQALDRIDKQINIYKATLKQAINVEEKTYLKGMIQGFKDAKNITKYILN